MLKQLSLFVLLLATFACAQTPLETAVAIRTKLNYTGRPHVIFLYSNAHLDWLEEPLHLRKLRKHLVGSAVIFKGFWKHGEADRSGVGTENGHYVWKDPQRMREAIQFLRDLDLKIFLYVAPHSWVADGLTGRQFVDEALRLRRTHGDIHFYLDGYQFGKPSKGTSGAEETLATLKALKAHGFSLFIHGSVAPNLGSTQAGQKAEFPMPGARLAEMFLWGETNDRNGEFIPWFRALASDIFSGQKRFYKPAKGTPFRDADGKVINQQFLSILLDRYLILDRFAPHNVGDFDKFYWPKYKAARERYEADPEKFVQQKVRVFE